MNETSLTKSIKSLYKAPITDAEAREAASNLLGFFDLLVEIDREQPRKHPTPAHEA